VPLQLAGRFFITKQLVKSLHKRQFPDVANSTKTGFTEMPYGKIRKENNKQEKSIRLLQSCILVS
jgi:hypothetical protein